MVALTLNCEGSGIRRSIQYANIAKSRDLHSEISILDRKAQNAALRADQEISRPDIDRCRGQAVAFHKQAESLRS